MLKQPQLFVKIGPNQFVPVERPRPDRDVYAWDDTLKRIVLKEKVEQRK